MFAKDKVSQSLIDSVNKVLDKKESEQLNEAFPTVADAKKRASEPKPSGGSGVKLGTRYGGGRQKDEPEHDDDDDKPKEKRGKYGARQKRFTNTKLYKEDLTFTDRLIESMYGKKGAIPMDEKEMTPAQAKKKEEIVMSMKDNTDQFKKKYGKRWKEVMYATATKQAMKEDADQIDEKIDHSQRTTDTLAGRTKGGKDNEHSSYKVAYKHEDTDVEESGLRMAAHAAAKQGKKSFEFQGKTMPVTVKKEEVEELDELKKSTLGSYVKKAAQDAEEAGRDQEHYGHKNDYARGEKRQKGIAKAVDRLTKEEVEELDELKKSTVASYIQKKFGKMSDEPVSKNQYGYAKKDAKGIRSAGLRMSGIKATQNEEVELDESHKVGDSVIVNSKFFGKQKGKVVKVDKQSVHVQRNGKKYSEEYPHDSVMKEEVDQMDEMKNTPANKPPYKLKSFSSLKKEMLGKAGMTSEGKSDEE